MPARHRTVLAAVMAAAALLAACSPGATWTEYVYKPNRFAVSFTAPPKVDPDTNPFLVEENDGEVDLGVSAACNVTTDKTPDQMMEAAIEGTRLSGTVRNVTYTASGQVMGRELFVDRPGQPTIRQRIFARDKCIYLVFAGAKSGTDDERVAHFLDSFRLL